MTGTWSANGLYLRPSILAMWFATTISNSWSLKSISNHISFKPCSSRNLYSWAWNFYSSEDNDTGLTWRNRWGVFFWLWMTPQSLSQWMAIWGLGSWYKPWSSQPAFSIFWNRNVWFYFRIRTTFIEQVQSSNLPDPCSATGRLHWLLFSSCTHWRAE